MDASNDNPITLDLTAWAILALGMVLLVGVPAAALYLISAWS